jgi:hypothetical protein
VLGVVDGLSGQLRASPQLSRLHFEKLGGSRQSGDRYELVLRSGEFEIRGVKAPDHGV